MGKKLLILTLLAAFLIGMSALHKHLKKRHLDLAIDSGVGKLLPQDMLVADVNKIEIFAVAKDASDDKANRVTLVREKDGWQLASAFQAPGDKKKIDDLCKAILNMNGEIRPSVPEVLSNFELEEKQALHVNVYGKRGGQDASYHLLFGKKTEGSGQTFVRFAQDTGKVYYVAKDLRREMGLWGNETNKVPQSNHWLERRLLKVEKDKIVGISLVYPDKKLAFAKVEKVQEKKEEKKDDGKKDENKPEAKKEYEWKLTQGGFGKPHKSAAIEAFLNMVASFDAADVVDPQDKARYGLDNPTFRLTLEMEDKSTLAVVAGMPEVGKDAYCVVDGRPNLVYKVASWAFNDVFKKGRDWFDMPTFDLDKANIKELELTRPEGKVSLVRMVEKDKNEEKVSWLNPHHGLKVSKDTAEDIVTKLARVPWEDYTDETNPAALGLASGDFALTVIMKDDSKHTLSLGKHSPVLDGYYMQADGGKLVQVVEKYVYEGLFPTFAKLFTLEPFQVELQEFNLTRDNTSFTLRKTQDKWELVSGDKNYATQSAAIDKLVKTFQPLKAANLTLHQNDVSGRKVVAIASVKGDKDATPYLLNFYERKADEPHQPIAIYDKGWVYWLENSVANAILQGIADYQAKEESKSEAPVKTPDKEETPKTTDNQNK